MLFAHQSKDLENCKKELKTSSLANTVLEKRLVKTVEDLDCIRKNMVVAKEAEQELREAKQQERIFYDEQLKMLSQQRVGLISAYKKQLLLMDNLKRQNVCLEQAKLIQIAEKDFTKMLDWNLSSKK